MNDVSRLANIIEESDQGMSFDDIVLEYSKKHRIVNDGYFKNALIASLEFHKNIFHLNRANMLWEVRQGNKYLYVSDTKKFRKIRDAMLEIFSKSVNSGSAYFSTDETHAAWFPQPNNNDWENVLSDDQHYWYERPKNGADYTADNKLRYVFAHEQDGYRFTGLFRFVEMKADKTRVYELVDDKVALAKPERLVLVCRTTWMKEYRGITDDDRPIGGGSYVDENNDAFEKFNFLPQEDGLIHGFVETKYSKGHTADIQHANSIHIEKIDISARNSDRLENVRIVFVSFNPDVGKTFIVGWYDNAIVYRNRFEYNGFHTTMTCEPEDAHLIPIEKRDFEVPKASKENKYGIGQSNLWYIQNFSVAKEFENKINTYLDSMIK